MIVKLSGGDFSADLIQPFNVAMVHCAHRVTHVFPALVRPWELAEGGVLHLFLRTCQEGDQAPSLEHFRDGQACELAEGWVNVHKLHQRAGLLSVCLGPGQADDEGSPGIDLVVRLFAPATVLSQFPSMITP